MLNGLDLFSGIGGMSVALEPWVRTVAYCEREPAAQRILLSRMYRGEIERAPIWDDVRTLRGSTLPPIDVISGGFPCQDLSSAGLQAGLGGERSGLFYQIIRLAGETKASILFLENVKGVSKFIPAIRNEIESLGYSCRDGFITAASVGAHHKRERWFLLAYSNGFAKRIKRWGSSRQSGEGAPQSLGALENGKVTDTESFGFKENGLNEFRHEKKLTFSAELLEGDTWDEYASFLLRMDNGLPYKSDRIRALGNSVVPLQARVAFQRLCGLT